MAKVYGTQSIGIGGDVRAIGHSSIAIGGDDIETAKPDLNTVVPDMAVAGTQKTLIENWPLYTLELHWDLVHLMIVKSM